jgi:hypothetical protein
MIFASAQSGTGMPYRLTMCRQQKLITVKKIS